MLTHGGRVLSDIAPRAITQEGLLLPPTRPTNDSSGRIFLIFLDDQNIAFRETAAVRDLLKKISTELVHEGDLFGIVSTGPSSIAVDMTYDRKRLDEATNKIMGNGLLPNTNDFTEALKRIDAETSDYYVLGYYSSNPDPLKKRRTIEIRVKQKAKLQLTYKTSYTLKPGR